MRKIEREMLWAFLTVETLAKGNTTVSHDPVIGGIESEVRLHGHLIAKRYLNGELEINLCGYNTVTTRSRLNALIRGLAASEGGASYPSGLGVSSRKGVIRLHDARGETVIDAHGWHKVYF